MPFEREYKLEWGEASRPFVEECWKIEGEAVDRILKLVEALGRWEDSRTWSDHSDSFNEAVRRVGICLITWQTYASIRRMMKLYGVDRTKGCGIWGVTYICQVPRRGGLKTKALRTVERWVEENGRSPSRNKARELIRSVAPDVIKMGPRAKKVSDIRKDFQKQLKEKDAEIKELRTRLRDCMRGRVADARLIQSLRKENAKLKKSKS